MKVSQLLPSVRAEVERPFQEKLARARQLIKLWANRNACVSCSFGKDSTVVLYLAREVNPQIPVVFNNTGVEYRETLEFKEFLTKEWNLNLIETKPEISFWEIWKGKRMPDGSKRLNKRKHLDFCCQTLKEKPMKEVIKRCGFQVNFVGLTAVESRQRMLTACQKGQEYYSKTWGILKVQPILYWTPEEVWRFIEENNIPINPAYKKYGLNRVGCQSCTAHKGWREELLRTNPRMYKLISEKYFGQKLLVEVV